MTSIKTLVCDVGSGSVRVAILEYSSDFIIEPIPLAYATKSIQIFNPQPDFYEQNSTEIWNAFCECSRKCLIDSQIQSIDSIAFSATCSLVILEEKSNKNDIILWMDHRAKKQAAQITQSGHHVLQQFGGSCSPEFSLSKLVWLKENDEERFKNANGFMELPDWMSYRCSDLFGKPEEFSRSLCSVVCKWGFEAENLEWPTDLFEKFGLSTEQSKFGTKFALPGKAIALLNDSVSIELGFANFNPKTVIASPLIDAHAGMLSMITFGNTSGNWENVLGIITGTSACHMLLNQKRVFSKGIWGPYKHAIVPDFYLREAGQSATGKLIDDILSNYFDTPLEKEKLSEIIRHLNKELAELSFYKSSLLINPSFHGNRSPIGNYDLKGAVYGMTLKKPKLLDLYVATIEALAYETKHILEVAQSSCGRFRKIIVTGGLAKNEFYMQTQADVLDCTLFNFSAGNADLMLVGASIIALIATQSSKDVNEILIELSNKNKNFSQNQTVYIPRKEHSVYHEKKYQSYKILMNCCVELCKNNFF